MRFSPPYWQGIHPAFPKRPPELEETDSALFTYGLTGAAAGGATAAASAFFNRYAPGKAVKYIGAASILFALWDLGSRRARVKRDVLPFLQSEGVTPPKYRLWERTSSWTPDDTFLIGASLGFMRALWPRAHLTSLSRDVSGFRRIFESCLRFAGSMAVGGVAISTPSFAGLRLGDPDLQEFQERNLARARWNQELAKARSIYETKSGKEAPAWLYPSSMIHTIRSLKGMPFISATGEQPPGQAHIHMVSEPNGPEHAIEPMPKGFGPHIALKVDDEIKYSNARDYYWKPDSLQEGIRALEAHINTLTERRLDLVREAEYLWLEVAKQEATYFKDKSDDDSESRRRLRAKLELLSSIHMNTYEAISEYDWMIADSKKLMLQLKSGGEWEPTKPAHIDPKSYVPERILEMLKEHKKRTELQRQQWGSLLTATTPEDQKGMGDGAKEVEDNDIATGELVEDFEQRVKNTSSFEQKGD